MKALTQYLTSLLIGFAVVLGALEVGAFVVPLGGSHTDGTVYATSVGGGECRTLYVTPKRIADDVNIGIRQNGPTGDLLGTITAGDVNTLRAFVAPSGTFSVTAEADAESQPNSAKLDIKCTDEGFINAREFGALPGTADSAPDIEAAILEACAMPEALRGGVKVPGGVYTTGSGIAAQFYSGVNLPCNVEWFGDGKATILEPNVPTGQTVAFVCGGYDSHGDVDSCTTLTDVSIHDIHFRDPDPYAHGHATTIATYTTCTSCDGNLTFEDSLTWTGGTGTFNERVAGDNLLSLTVDTGTLETDDVVTNGTASISGLSGIAGPTSEESHGLTVFEATVKLERAYFTDLADEGLDAKAGALVLVRDSEFRGVSQTGSGGSSINAAANAIVDVRDTLIIPGNPAPGGTGGAGLSIEGLQSGGTIADSPHLSATGVTIIEDGSTPGTRIEALIAVGSSQHDVTGITVSSSYLDSGSDTDATAVFEASGSNGIDAALIGNTIIGGRVWSASADAHDIVLSGGTFLCKNDTVGCVNHMQTVEGLFLRSIGTADPAINFANDGGSFTGNRVIAEQSCMVVSSGNGVQVTENSFTCGENTSGLDYVIRFLGTSNDVLVEDNYIEGFASGAGTHPFRSGLAGSAVNDNDGAVTTTGTISATTNRGDITP